MDGPLVSRYLTLLREHLYLNTSRTQPL